MSKFTRREFIEHSMLATAATAAAAYTIAPEEADAQQPRAANDTLNVAILGCRIRGPQHASALNRIPGVRITHVCDPDSTLRGRLAEAIRGRQQGAAPTAVADMRRIFDDRTVDAVFVATPNHWHALAAIWAMQAGKDVYVEKPVSHNISEGRRIVQVARRTRRICQAGTQRRSNTALAAIADYIRQGRLGTVRLARSIMYRRRNTIGPAGRHLPPANVDYNLFCGPAPMSPLTRRTFHYDWHWFWETGNGELGNNNIHTVDVCRWLLGLNNLGRSVLSYGGRVSFNDAAQTPNTQICIHDFGDKTIAQETRNLPTGPFSRALPGGWIIYGSEGTIAGTTLFDGDNRRVRTFPGGDGDHFANFLSAVRSRRQQDLKADILEGHLSSSLCHVANISYQVGEPAAPAEIIRRLGTLEVHDNVRETFDRTRQHLTDNNVNIDETRLTLGAHLRLHAEREEFVGNERANALLTREYRRPFVVPSEREVQSAGG